MRIDRILGDILQWVGQVVWWREEKVSPRPYEKIQTWRIEGMGLLHRVIRPQRLCPRDVGSYIFEPFRYRHTEERDIHILCDHLDGMSKAQDWGSMICTHRITVLIADHWVGADGRYEAEELFSLDDDFQGQSNRRDFHVLCILYQVAIAVAASMDLTTFDFLREIDDSKKVCMRGQYTHTLQLPRPTGYVIARPVDGGAAVRIRLH